MLKKALLWGEDRNQIEHRTGFLQFYVKTKKVCRCFASFSSEQEHFTHGMYMTAPIRSSDVKQSKRGSSVVRHLPLVLEVPGSIPARGEKNFGVRTRFL